jgi:hypothetical protein
MREFTHTTTSTLSCHVVESNVSILDNQFICSAHANFYWEISSFAMRKGWIYASTLSHDMSSKKSQEICMYWHSIVLFHQCSSCIFITLSPRIHPRIHRFHPSFPPIPNPSQLPRMKTCLANSMRLPRLPLQAMFLIDKGVVSLLSLFENGRHKRRAATNRMTSVHMSVFPLQITPPPKGQLEMGCDLLLMFLQLLFIQTI